MEKVNQNHYLNTLTHVSGEHLKPFVDSLLPRLGDDIEVIYNRTGLVMLPYTDSVNGTVFHLGEVLIAEAQVRLSNQEGYGAVLGRDLEQALAVALLDAALQANLLTEEIMAFLDAQAQFQTAADELLLRQVEATRVEMETF